MAVTTTDSMSKALPLRRPRCGKLGRGGVVLNGAAWCHFTRSEKLVYPELESISDEIEEPGVLVVQESAYRKSFKRLGGS